MASNSIKVFNSGPVKVTRAETNGKAMAFVSGGAVKVEAAPAVGSIRLVGTPGPQGAQGPAGQDGNLTDGVVLDGGNF